MRTFKCILLCTLLSIFLVDATNADVAPLRGGEKNFSIYHLHPYPICFYDTDLGAVAAARELWKLYPQVIIDAINAKRRRQTEISIVSSRTALVRSTLNHHRELANIWPDVACVGRSGGATSAEAAKICRSYVRAFIISQIEHVSMPPGTIEPICQTFLPEQ